LSKLSRVLPAFGLLIALAAATGPAGADEEGLLLNQNLVTPANQALKEAIRAECEAHQAKLAADKANADAANASIVSHEEAATALGIDDARDLAQARPIGEHEAPALDPALTKGFNYTLDVSSAWALGNTGHNNINMPGGMDAVLAYGFTKHLRLFAGYYQVQEFPLGFDTGIVPVYLQGIGPPISSQNLHDQQLDVTTKDKFFITLLQNLAVFMPKAPLPLPVIISPGYISRTASINNAGNGDVQTIEINGFPQTVHLRSAQVKLVSFTIPFLSSPKMFGTITLAPQWQMNITGAQQTNHMQLLQLLYLEYRLNPTSTIFFQPSHVPAYLAPDPYPEHLGSWIYGVTHNFTKNVFVQGTISTGTPTNVPQLGIQSLTCLQLPCNQSQVAPSLGGLKATQVQLMFGVGTPSVVPL
jgi:hypothetical protein